MTMRAVLLSLASCLLLFAPASAQNAYNWSGGPGDWDDPAKWIPNGVPADTDTAYVINGALITLPSGTTTVAGLVLETGGSTNGLTGPGDLSVADSMVMHQGNLLGTGTVRVEPGAALTIASTTVFDFQIGAGSFLNAGVATWEAGRFSRIGATGQFVNEGEIIVTIDATSGTQSLCFVNSADFMRNAASGLIRRAGPGLVQILCDFENAGTIRVQSGTFGLLGPSNFPQTHPGDFEVEENGTLAFIANTHTIEGDVTGPGTLLIGSSKTTATGLVEVGTLRVDGSASSFFALNGSATLPQVELAGSALLGSASYTITDAFEWANGTLGGTGTTTVAADATFEPSLFSRIVTGERTLRLEGETTWMENASANANASTSRIINAGTMRGEGTGSRTWGRLLNEGTFVNMGGVNNIGTFTNMGTVRVEGGSVQVGGMLDGADTGRYEITGDGSVLFGGTRTFEPAVEVVGDGSVTVGGSVVNNATWRPAGTGATGVLSIIQGFALADAGVLDIEIGGLVADTEYDQLVVGSSAILGGTLRVTLTDGFTPSEGDRFLVVAAAGGATGAFGQLELPDGLKAFVEASATGAELVIGTPVATEPGESLPEVLALHPPAPNPTRGVSSMQVDLPAPARVRLALYDALGRELAVVLDDDRPAGRHTVALATDRLAAGVYVVRLVAGGEPATQRLTVVR